MIYLSVSANDFHVVGPGQPLSLLFHGTLPHDGRDEHDEVKSECVTVRHQGRADATAKHRFCRLHISGLSTQPWTNTVKLFVIPTKQL